MTKSNSLHVFRLIFSLLIMMLFTACDQSSPNKTTTLAIPTLDNGTVKTFAIKFQEDYDKQLNSLLTQFDRAYKNNDSYSFTDFRNNKWTPAYIKHKNFYAEVYNQNKDFLKTSQITPLFQRFESLIYIGINLKNGLLDSDKTLIEQTLTEAKADQKLVHSIVAATR